MKRRLVLSVAAVLVMLAVVPSAFARRFILDPTPAPFGAIPPGTTCTSDAPCNVFYSGQQYANTWIPCTDLPPTNPLNPSNGSGLDFCLWFNNVSGASINKLTFSMMVPASGPDALQDLTCAASPAGITFSCPTVVPPAGDPLVLTFFGNPLALNDTNYFLGTDFFDMPDSPSVVQSVPEPGVLGLFGFGVAIIGIVFGWERRRHHPSQGRG